MQQDLRTSRCAGGRPTNKKSTRTTTQTAAARSCERWRTKFDRARWLLFLRRCSPAALLLLLPAAATTTSCCCMHAVGLPRPPSCRCPLLPVCHAAALRRGAPAAPPRCAPPAGRKQRRSHHHRSSLTLLLGIPSAKSSASCEQSRDPTQGREADSRLVECQLRSTRFTAAASHTHILTRTSVLQSVRGRARGALRAAGGFGGIRQGGPAGASRAGAGGPGAPLRRSSWEARR